MTLRQSTGIPELDALLGGGLLSGTLTVVLGATGIGKTQLGLQYAHQGLAQEGERGVLFDLTARGDSQSHNDYSERMFGWKLRRMPIEEGFVPTQVWETTQVRYDVLHLFHRAGKRVTLSDLNEDQQREWKAELNRKLLQTIGYFYGNFAHGVRRCVIDGLEPTDRASDSFQFELFEYIYHQILRKEHDWVARDLFRAGFREQSAEVARHAYNHQAIGCLLLCTTKEIFLDDLLERRIESGDVLANANTIILMGKTRSGSKIGRALYVAKHRGSALDERIAPFTITEQGLRIEA